MRDVTMRFKCIGAGTAERSGKIRITLTTICRAAVAGKRQTQNRESRQPENAMRHTRHDRETDLKRARAVVDIISLAAAQASACRNHLIKKKSRNNNAFAEN
ncbi:hypothetical protein [Paraburkholderia saeva]|uniref:hypothetical protein n=1 Tax=Paraburkholderia saeva TaxID=2777537 RepID=UPI001E44F400|nr:hypothetical protein [Paraburkholderia saeva]